MTPVLKTSRRLLLWNIVQYTFPNKAVYAMYFDKVTIVYCLYRILGYICLYHIHTISYRVLHKSVPGLQVYVPRNILKYISIYPKVAAVSSIYRIHKKNIRMLCFEFITNIIIYFKTFSGNFYKYHKYR